MPSSTMPYLHAYRAILAAALALMCFGMAASDSLARAPLLVESAPPLARGWQVKTVATGISHPWGLAWLPGGDLLVTSREGAVQLLRQGRLTPVPLDGLPALFAEGQGGLLDISVHPKAQTAEGALVYMTLSTGTAGANRTILVRGVFKGQRITGIHTLFQAKPDKSGGEHFGSRLLWLADGTLLMSIGDGGNPPRKVAGKLSREQAQNLTNHLGSILRFDDNGTPPSDQPFMGRPGAEPAIWSYGHRNIQGLARDPLSGRIWASEHGPLGGDELNLVAAGQNFGWPLATYGRDYRTGASIGQLKVTGSVDPSVVWLPTSVAPSGLAVYTGTQFPAWQGDVFSGNLVTNDIHRVILDSHGSVQSVERLPIGERVRDVRMGPDGYLYLLTDEDNGKILRIEPAR